MKRDKTLWVPLAGCLILAGIADETAADPRGIWLTERGKSHVHLAPCSSNVKRLCGKIAWLKNPRLDVKNDDESLRDRPLLGIDVVWDPKHEGGGEWDDGQIYNSSDGDSYDSEMEEIDANTLKVSGCVWFICKEQTWKRVK